MKEYLSRKDVPFREIDVSRDAAGAAEMVRLTGQRGVPVTVIDGSAVVGFDRAGLDQLLARAQRPRLGAAVADAADMAAQGRCTSRSGAYVGKITPDGNAARAGLQVGDVIITLAGQRIENAPDVERLVARLLPGRPVSLVYLRGSSQYETTVGF